MLTALVFASLSAVCMALMVVTDRLMVGDCYRGKPNHAWFVSSLAGSLFGLFLTAIVWVWGHIFIEIPAFYEFFNISIYLFVWKGVAAFVFGVLGIQILLHYFRCFSEGAHSSVIAAWIASTPIFVFISLLILEHVFNIGEGITPNNSIWLLGILLATIGLIVFERLTGGPKGSVGVYRRELIILLFISVVYTIGLKQIFVFDTSSVSTLTNAAALMPYYWLGFGAGIRIMLKNGEWSSFRTNWQRRIRYFIVPIIFVEIIGMLVFFFEYISLTKLDPTTVSLILGVHVILVYILDLLLGWYRQKMEQRDERRIYVLGIRLLKHKLPEAKLEPFKVMIELFVVLIITLGIALITVHLG